MVEPPQTDEGWFVLHDFRSVDWDAWREAPQRERERAIEEGVEYLQTCEAVADAAEGDSAVFSILGDAADLLILHFRPTLDDLSALERQFEQTALGGVTDQTESYVSVTEVSGYTSDTWFEGDREEINAGLRRYIEGKLHPEIPEDQYVSFYPMSKRRLPEYNWYDLPFEERAELMAEHGESGKAYAGKIHQVIASSVGFEDHEWGVTLFGADPTDIKDIVYEMRFDEASSKYGEFGDFFVGRRFPPTDLAAFLAGERVPTGERDAGTEHPHGSEVASAHGDHHGGGHDGDAHHSGDDGDAHHSDDQDEAEGDIRGELEEMDIYAGQPHGEDVYATVLYSEADVEELFGEVEGLRANFDHYDTHVKTGVYEASDRDRAAVVSIWDTASAAETAAGFLSELPGVVSRAGEESGFGTMGMFYTVKPEYREDFHEKFDVVGGLLADMEGHQETDLMVNLEDENDMFIASQWRSQDDAMAFFRSEEFSQTVSWGRDVLADRPRHVFLA
ncbi:MAG: heme-binding protein [Halolamina sp.]